MEKKQRTVVTLYLVDKELDNIIEKLNDPEDTDDIADRNDLARIFITAKEELYNITKGNNPSTAIDIKLTKDDAFFLLNYFMTGKL